jgi:DNA-binding MarR family transcriptional regulator
VAELAAEIDRDLRAVRQRLRQPVESAIASGGLTGPQQAAMAVLVRSGGSSLKGLSEALGLAHSTVSGIVDRLEKRGLAERQSGEPDRRVTRIVASRQVQKYMKETWPELERHPLEEALERATAAERAAIARGIRTLRKVLERAGEA